MWPRRDRAIFQQAGEAGYALLAEESERGEDLFAQLFSRYPTAPNLHLFYGLLLFPHDPTLAIDEFQSELAVNASNETAHAMLAYTLMIAGRSRRHSQRLSTHTPSLPTQRRRNWRWGGRWPKPATSSAERGYSARSCKGIPTTSKRTWAWCPSTPEAAEGRTQTVSVRSASSFPSSARTRLAAFCVLIGAVLPHVSGGQSPSPKPVPITCGTGHAGVTAHYAGAPMRHALEPEGASPQLALHPNLTAQLGKYTYSVQTKDGHGTYTVTDGTDTMTLPIRWIFGQKTQTWVLEKGGHLYESLVSYFPRDDTLSTSPGDQGIKPQEPDRSHGT